jgi:hypothetical protein
MIDQASGKRQKTPMRDNKAVKVDELAKSRKSPFSVIPAKAPMNAGSSTGIQSFQSVNEHLGCGLHRSDNFL